MIPGPSGRRPTRRQWFALIAMVAHHDNRKDAAFMLRVSERRVSQLLDAMLAGCALDSYGLACLWWARELRRATGVILPRGQQESPGQEGLWPAA